MERIKYSVKFDDSFPCSFWDTKKVSLCRFKLPGDTTRTLSGGDDSQPRWRAWTHVEQHFCEFLVNLAQAASLVHATQTLWHTDGRTDRTIQYVGGRGITLPLIMSHLYIRSFLRYAKINIGESFFYERTCSSTLQIIWNRWAAQDSAVHQRFRSMDVKWQRKTGTLKMLCDVWWLFHL